MNQIVIFQGIYKSATKEDIGDFYSMDKEKEMNQRIDHLLQRNRELEERINSLSHQYEDLLLFNKVLLEQREQEDLLQFAWAGNLGHWYWNVKSNTVTFNPLKITTLGYKTNEIPDKVTYQFFTDMLHPDDYSKAMDAMLKHMNGEKSVYEVEYRIRTKDGKYKWYYDRGKITERDSNGKPLLITGIVFDITDNKIAEDELVYKNKIRCGIKEYKGSTIADFIDMADINLYKAKQKGKNQVCAD